MENKNSTLSQVENPNRIRTITLEEHYATPVFMEGPGLQIKAQAKAAQDHPQVAGQINLLIEQLCDLGSRRIADMDAAGIDMQVLSLTSPGTEQLEENDAIALSREANDILAEAIQRNPDRFAGFAALPTASPDIAADELDRMVQKHGFKGALINGHIKGRYLDDEFFWPILERAEALNVPLYIHPTPPPQSVIKEVYKGNYSPEIMGLMATAAWGWHIETANHILRIILSGAFDRYPNLQLIVGHLGETLPFMIPRLDLGFPRQITKLQRTIGDYLRKNIYYTFSGFNWTPAFLDLFLQVGVDRIMFSADYPYSSMKAAHAFLDQLPVSPSDKERIAHGNAEHLLRL